MSHSVIMIMTDVLDVEWVFVCICSVVVSDVHDTE